MYDVLWSNEPMSWAIEVLGWLCTVLTLWGVWLLGRKHRHAFVIACTANVGWMVWAYRTHSPSVLATNLVLFILSARNWWLWGKEPTS